jgi:23S rRNA pseudouridine2605 synthase
MLERLQKIISAAGVTSRRAAEQLISEGRVRVNGKVVTELGTKADPSKDHIKVDGKLINPKQPPTYIMLNKPAGFVTTMSDPEGRPTVQDLLKGIKTRVYPVGRLDYNTEGLLLLTNDGDFAHLITHPKHEFPKTYLAKVKGVLEERQIEMLEKGMFLQDGKTAPAKVKKVRKEEMNSWVEITIYEGRKRQVRRMFDHVGRSVIKLKRIKTGSLSLGDLPEGRFRHLTTDEVNALRETALKTDDSGQKIRVYKPAVMAQKQERPLGAQKKEVMVQQQGRPFVAQKQNRQLDSPRTRVMQETTDGRRQNQGARPGTGSGYSRSKGPGAAAGFRSQEDRSYGPATRSATSRPTTRAAAGRPTTRTSARRPEAGAAAWKTDSRRKPGQGAWPSTRPSETKSSGFGRGPQGEGRRPSSGPRPNRSTRTGSKGPRRVTKFGGRGAGRKK